jgi:hypothetical protein
LFKRRVTTLSLPRFIATSGAWLRLTVGSALDGGPDWADDATRLDVGVPVACEVDRGVVVALVGGPATPVSGVASPVLGPADVLPVLAFVAGFR